MPLTVADIKLWKLNEDEITQLGLLLARYHNYNVTEKTHSFYGAPMDRALCRDMFSILFRQGNCNELNNLASLFNQ